MKDLQKMTRKELATILVEEQIKAGIVNAKNKERLIKMYSTMNFNFIENIKN